MVDLRNKNKRPDRFIGVVFFEKGSQVISHLKYYFMIFKSLSLKLEVKDYLFNALYPSEIKRLARRHWTPVEVARSASDYLVTKRESNVLDIGSGAGKFCLVGAASTKGNFYGVEQRKSLVRISQEIAVTHELNNAVFINSNITEIDFSHFDAFYSYNPFFENLDSYNAIDTTIGLSAQLYCQYNDYVKGQLIRTPKGTRLVTYWGNWDEVPENFDIQYTDFDGKLNFWEKKS